MFTVPPKKDVCGKDADGNQLYPMASDRDDEYKYTVGLPVAAVKDFGYPSVADAKAARTDTDDVIKLLKDADYAFVAGDILKIFKANDQIKFTYTVQDTFALSISNPDANGVVTYQVVGSVAKIEREGETLYFATIQEAVDAANENEVIEVIAAGTYTLPNLPKKVTIEGAVDNVVFSHTGTGNIANTGAGAAFKNVTFELGNNNYHGFQHNGGLTFEGCTFNGKLFTYGSETFKNCTFNQTNKDYHLWIYGGDNTVAFEGCTFTNTTTGKFLNVYNENGAPINLTINNCKFINEGSESKAAVNVKETCGTTPLNFNVTITGCTTEGAFPESSETAALVVGERGLWQVDDRLTNGAEPGVVVFLDDVQVYPVYKASVSDGTTTTKYTSLKNAITAANALSGEVTVTMLADDTVAVDGYALTINTGKNIILDLKGHDVVGACASSGTSALIRNLGTLTIQDSGENGKLIGGADPTWTWDGSDDYSGSYASNLIRNEGTLVVNSGYLYNASTGSAAYAIDNYSAGKVTINGGTIDAKKASAIRLFYNNGGEITVNGGTIGHYTNDNDCTYMGIQVMSGTNAVVNVNGGTIAGMYALYSNGTGSSAVNITDGTFDGDVGFGSAGPENISIKGGKFTCWVGTWGDQVEFISGGLYAEKPDAEYIVRGKCAIQRADEWWEIGEAVAEIGTIGYATLEAAFADAEDGDTIKVLKDIEVAQMINVTKTVTLDLDGHKVSRNNGGSIVMIKDGATLTIDGTKENSEIYGRINVGTSGNNNGSVVLNGGYYHCCNSETVLHVNGECLNSNVTIKDAKVTSPDDNGIQLNGKGTHVIENSTISGKTAVYIKAGTVTVTGSTLESTAAAHTDYNFYNNGSNPTGDAVVIDVCGYPGGDPSVAFGDGNTIKVAENSGNLQIGYYEKEEKETPAVVTAKDNTLTVPKD